MDIKQKDMQADGGGVPSTGTVDIGKAFNAMTADPDWLSKSVLVGAIATFVPLIGYVVMLGWMREIFDRNKAGDSTLPTLDFGAHMSLGWAPFASVFSVGGALMALLIGGQILMFPLSLIVGAVQGTAVEGVVGALVALLGMGMMLVMMVVMFAVSVSIPEIMRRGFRGEALPILSPMTSIRAVKNNAGAFLMLVLGGFVFNMVSQAGAMACFVGILVTMPVAMIGLSNLLAQWDRVVDPQG